MGSALLDTTLQGMPGAAAAPSSGEALRLQVAERLAAHRSRRGLAPGQPATQPGGSSRPNDSRSARIAATVAERYNKSQSYRAFLAAEAERAVQQAHAAAEIAARNARAVAAAQQKMLEEFEADTHQEAAPEIAPTALPDTESRIAPHAELRPEPAQQHSQEMDLWPELAPLEPARPKARAHKAPPLPEPSAAAADGGLTVRFLDETPTAAHLAPPSNASRGYERNEAEASALDAEIAFRQAPVFEEPAGPPMPLPANLIEFPRQLIAPRKARPRLAEGPLREDAEDGLPDGQLRIFEVDPAQISTAPPAETDATPEPQWTSIWLDTPTDQPTHTHEAADEPMLENYARYGGKTGALPEVATIQQRLLASAVNAGVVSAGTVAFAAAFVLTTNPGLNWRSAGAVHAALRGIASQTQPGLLLAAAIATVAFLCVLYQSLFFSLSQATPGMRCARIALCTFNDENPSCRQRRQRMLATLLSACPLGLGYLWTALDEERLAWHDRLSKMYLRSY